MRQKLGFALAVALVLRGLSVKSVCSVWMLLPVDQDVYLYPSGDPPTGAKYFDVCLAGETTVSISLSVQTGGLEDFYIADSSNKDLYVVEGDLATNNFTSLQQQWTAPYDDNFTFKLWGLTAYNTNVHVTIQQIGNQPGGGGFDPLPVVVVAIVLLAVLTSLFLIVRMRRQAQLPQPGTEEPPRPPP